MVPAAGRVGSARGRARFLYSGAQITSLGTKERSVNLTPRELDKLLIYMMADVALKRKAKGIKLNHPETVALISAAVLDGAREGKTLEQVMTEGRTAVTSADVMDGVVDLIPYVQLEALFTDGSRLVTIHSPIQ
jgi:urease subunit gamma